MIASTIIALAVLGQTAYHSEYLSRSNGDPGGSLYSYCIAPPNGTPQLRTLDAYHDDGSTYVRLILRIADAYVDVMQGELLSDGITFGSPRAGSGHTLLANWLYGPSGDAQWLVPWDHVIRDPDQMEFNDCHFTMATPPLAGTTRLVGDATLDGMFDSSDLIAVFTAGQYEDGVRLNSRWADGDWNADGEFDSGDLVVALQTGRYEQPAAASQVPEPTKISGLILAAIAPAGLQRLRRLRTN